MITSGQQTVGTAPTQIDGNGWNYSVLHIHNDDNDAGLFIGNSDVSTTTGLLLQKLERITLTLSPSDVVHVVSTKAGHKISWLRVMDT